MIFKRNEIFHLLSGLALVVFFQHIHHLGFMYIKLFTALITLALIFPSVVFAETKSVCDAGIEQKMQESQKKYEKALSELLQAKEPKSELTDESLKQLRSYYCELDTVCQLAEFLYLKQSDIAKSDFQPQPFTCKSYPEEQFSKPFPIEDYKGDTALCSYSNNPQELARIKESCQSRLTLKVDNAMIQVKSEFRLASKQDQGNYYSAKLLSIADRLQSMADSLQRLNQLIRRVFESIFCRCP